MIQQEGNFSTSSLSLGLQRLQQRISTVLIDRVLELSIGERLVAIKNVTRNESVFNERLINTHLPESNLIEMMSQAAHILILEDTAYANRLLYCEKIEHLAFLYQAYPGDQLRIEVELTRVTDQAAFVKALIMVNDNIICEAKLQLKLSLIPSRPQIHPSAFVHPSAVLGKDVVIGPNTHIGEHVIIGDRSILESHILIEKWTKIGEDCHVHCGAVIGGAPQDKKYTGEKSWVLIGDRNQIREYVTINRGTKSGGGVTRLGSDNLLLAYVHIGHDCLLKDKIVISNSTNLAGHVEIDHEVVIGGMTGIHQFTRVGRQCMIGGYSKLVRDIPPFTLCDGNPAQVHGLNLIGLRRAKIAKESISELKEAYKTLYRSDMAPGPAVEKLKQLGLKRVEAKHFVDFCATSSKRGLTH